MIDMTNEEWRPIPSYEGFYSVSNFGRVRSEKRIITEIRNRDCFVPKTYSVPEKILKASVQTTSGKGYHRVSLSIHSKIKYLMVHHIVADAFIGRREKGQETRHLDGNCRNNRADNLVYGSKAENMQDAIKHGTFPRWEDRPGAKITRFDAVEICERGLTGESSASIAKDFGLNPCSVNSIWRGDYWKEFTNGIRPKRDFRKFKYFTEEQLNILNDTSLKQCVVAKMLNVERHFVSKWRKKIIAGQ